MSGEHPGATVWLSHVTLEGSDQPVRVVLESREGSCVFVRQADPGDGDPPRVPVQPGDDVVMMTALSHIGHHTTPDVGRTDDLLFGTRIVPVRREPGRVFARTLRRDEPDDGTRVHVRPGDQVEFEIGSVVAELDAIDDLEPPTATGHVPLTPVLWTWLLLGGRPEATTRYLLAAARRLDAAAMLLGEVEALRIELAREDLAGPALRRALFSLIGTVELTVIALGRVVDMASQAARRIGTDVPLPPTIADKQPAITAFRNAYEHIEDRALGQVVGKPDPQALTIFDYQRLVTEDVITYASHTLDLTTEIPALFADAREFFKDVAADT